MPDFISQKCLLFQPLATDVTTANASTQTLTSQSNRSGKVSYLKRYTCVSQGQFTLPKSNVKLNA